MNLTRWSARLPGTQRRRSADALTALPPARSAEEPDEEGNGGSGDGTRCGGEHEPALRDVLAHAPAPIAVTTGPEHRITYVNGAYTRLFGARTVGAPAAEALPELAELGILPLMDQVLRSGRPRTVRVRRVAPEAAAEPSYYSFVCAPVRDGSADPAPQAEADPDPAPGGVQQLVRTLRAHRRSDPAALAARGVLVFATDVTDQVQATERYRESERRHRETAVTLQRSLLPEELEQPDDLRAAAVYHPGGGQAAVGGDWYDVITLGGGRTALVIGDVMGRGVRAAAVMGQLRTAVRAYARLDLPPHEVLQLLDGLAMEIDSSQIATCTYAVYDPGESRIVHASAGHLPMVIRDADGTVRRVEHQAGPPLGTGTGPHTSESVPLLPGATAVLYTDGLVERRSQDIDEGLAELERALAGATGGPDVVCDRLLRSLGIVAEHDDDVAVLVVQLPERTPEQNALFRGATLELIGGTEAAPRARAFATGVLASWRLPDALRETGVLAVNELVANALTHGCPPMRLRLRRTHRRLIVEVSDGDEHLPRRLAAEPADEAGRGLGVVAALAAGWGSRRAPGGGKSVWCEFDLPAAATLPRTPAEQAAADPGAGR